MTAAEAARIQREAEDEVDALTPGSMPLRMPADWTDSMAAWLAAQTPDLREDFLRDLGPIERTLLARDWRFIGRRNQQIPTGEHWTIWLMMGGRGSGKTRPGAEATHTEVRAGRAKRTALIGATAADARDIIVEGDSGILATAPLDFRPTYEPSKRRLTWPNGAVATVYSADEPDRLRGPQHDWFWADEVAAWRYPAAWDQLMLGLRLGLRPRGVVTTTPKPVKLIREMVKRKDCVVTRSTSYENRANLAPAFLAEILEKYQGTRLYRQEVLGELLEDVPGALWTLDLLEQARFMGDLPPMVRVVVAIDPAVTSGEDADETGIVVCGKSEAGMGYVLADASGRMSAKKWADKAIELYRQFAADRIVAEVNNGGDLVEDEIRSVDPTVPYKAVNATRGKRKRAEPVSAFYEQGKIRHAGQFLKLEDQMVQFVPDAETAEEKRKKDSPDRVDALVWALTELMVKPTAPLIA
jgi:phage terminase large subunit-like protein